jgi:hypothetical protein
MSIYLFIIAAFLVTLLSLMLLRPWRFRPTREISSIGLGGAGLIVGVVVAGVWGFMDCRSSSDTFCSFGTLFFWGPFFMMAGAAIGLVIGHFRERKRYTKVSVKSYTEYAVALLGTAVVTFGYFWWKLGALGQSHIDALSWKAIGAITFVLFMFLAWLLRRKKNQ